MTTLVTGATGNVGRYLVQHLTALGSDVRCLTRNPARANFPAGVEVVAGDLDDISTLDQALRGVNAAHLICFAGDTYEPLRHGAEIVEALAADGTRRVTILKGDNVTSDVEAAAARSDMEWTILAPVEFMANTLDWAQGIRDGHLVEGFLDVASTVVHESDIARVAAHVLVHGGHHAETLWITGPEALTGYQRAEILADLTGATFEITNLTADELQAQWRSFGFSEADIAYMYEMRTNPPVAATEPQGTVLEVTDTQPLTFHDWIQQHRATFAP